MKPFKEGYIDESIKPKFKHKCRFKKIDGIIKCVICAKLFKKGVSYD